MSDTASTVKPIVEELKMRRRDGARIDQSLVKARRLQAL